MATAKEALAAKRAAAAKANGAKAAAEPAKAPARSKAKPKAEAAKSRRRTAKSKPEASETDGLTRSPGEKAIGHLTKAQLEALQSESQGPALTAFVSVTRQTKKGQVQVDGVTPEGIAVRLYVPEGLTPPTRIVLG